MHWLSEVTVANKKQLLMISLLLHSRNNNHTSIPSDPILISFSINHWLLDKALLLTAYYPNLSYLVFLLQGWVIMLPALRLALRLPTACQALSCSFHPDPCAAKCQPNPGMDRLPCSPISLCLNNGATEPIPSWSTEAEQEINCSFRLPWISKALFHTSIQS